MPRSVSVADASIIANDDAFAGREAIGFDDDAVRKLIEHLLRLIERVHDDETRRRYRVTCHEALGEALARLEARARAVGAEHEKAGVAQAIGDADGERRFGPDNDEVDRVLLRAIEDRARVDRGNVGKIHAARRRARVAGCVEDRFARRRLGKHRHDEKRVFTTRPLCRDDQDAHEAIPTPPSRAVST